MTEATCILIVAVLSLTQFFTIAGAYQFGHRRGVQDAFDRAKRFTLNTAVVFVALSAVAVAGQPCNVATVNTSSVFLQTGYPGYVLYQSPQVNYAGGAVGQTYEQTKHAKVEAELAEVKAMVRALAEKGLADGTVSAKAFAAISQPMVNQFCVGCHRVAAPEAGKGFALTDIATLTAEQRLKVIAVVMSDDETVQMPKAGSPQRKAWNAEAAGALLKEVSSIKSRPVGPVAVE
jgi:mono/diheme cytochrome c family protein